MNKMLLAWYRVRLCLSFSGQNEAFVTRLVQNTVASFLNFVESQKNGDRNRRSSTHKKVRFWIGDSGEA